MLLQLYNTPAINHPNYLHRGIAECCRVIQRASLRAYWMGGIIKSMLLLVSGLLWDTIKKPLTTLSSKPFIAWASS